MKIKLWGTRGSVPVPEKNMMKYGGNTSCVECYIKENDTLIILDAGTGIRQLGNDLLKRYKNRKIKGYILLSHTHWDHIQGFPFFVPAFIKGNEFTFYGNKDDSFTLEKTLLNQQEYRYFPVKLEEMGAKMAFNSIKQENFIINKNVKISSIYVNHPGVTLAYRIEYKDKIFVYATDHEKVFNSLKIEENQEQDIVFNKIKEADNRVIEFLKDADLVIYDAQYTIDEYKDKIGWGHSTYIDAIENSVKANVKKLILFHHDPMHDDIFLENNILKESKKYIKKNEYNLNIELAKELKKYII